MATFSTNYTFAFAFAICVVCSTALATVSLGLKDLQQANARRDLQKNILGALGLPEEGEVSGEAVDALWAEKIRVVALSTKTGEELDLDVADLSKNGVIDAKDFLLARKAVKGLTVNNRPKPPDFVGLFIRKDNKNVAIPMNGKGLWGPISGYVAFDPKVKTVQGTTFFAPKETPGLGAEITADAFEKSWIGKSIYANGKTKPIRVLKAAECAEKTDKHCVDGVSGATITSRGVDKMIASSLALYEPYLKTARK